MSEKCEPGRLKQTGYRSVKSIFISVRLWTLRLKRGIMGVLLLNEQEEIAMSETEIITKWEDRFDTDEREIANMDEYDFMTLLVESRIIQAS